MQIDVMFLLVAYSGVLIAAVSKTGFGGGASFVATPILALVIEPGLAVGIMLPLLMMMDVAGLRAYWGKWSRRDAWRLCLGSLPGIAAAAVVFRYTDPDVFRFLIGAISVAFVLFQGGRARGWIRARAQPLPASAGLLSGAVVGFTSFVAHAGGPPALIYLLSQHLTKTMFQATTVIVFAVINLIKAGLYTSLGIFTAEAMTLVAMLAPGALIGALLGVRAHDVVPQRLFFGLTYVLLLGAGGV